MLSPTGTLVGSASALMQASAAITGSGGWNAAAFPTQFGTASLASTGGIAASASFALAASAYPMISVGAI
jgi:hypothetical protein